MKRITKQSGMALVMVLLIVFMASLIATDMISRSQLDIHRTGNLLSLDQGHAYALGSEPFVSAVLQKAFEESDEWLTLSKQTLPDFVVPEGVLTISVEDLQARYNINSLQLSGTIENEEPGEGESVPQQQYSLELLLRALNFDTSIDTKAVSQSVLDWVDGNSIPSGIGGVEDDFYLLKDPPYRAGNTEIKDISELRLINGIDADAYSLIEANVSVLPAEARINVNTASVPVIRSLSEKISIEDANEIIRLRQEAPFETLPDILKSKGVSGNQLVFRSEYFRITTKAVINDRYSYLQSILYLPLNSTSSQNGSDKGNKQKASILGRNQSYRYIAKPKPSDSMEVEAKSETSTSG